MERTKYFNETRPTETQLNYTEETRSRTSLRRQRATNSMGVARGFSVTINSIDPTTIDIGPGEGYTGGHYPLVTVTGENTGERISTISDSASGLGDSPYTAQGQALAVYTAGAKNYVSLVYTETEDTPLAEISYPFTAHDTIVRESYSVSVLSESNWNLLTLGQLRQRIFLGIVTAQGAGKPLSSANIQQTVQPKTHPTCTQPTNITGVVLGSTSDETLIGTGTLHFTVIDYKLYWAAPGDTEGSGVSISSSGVYILYSHDTTYHITATVTYASLPASDEYDSIDIESMYGQDYPRYSAMDTVHRDMVGTGTASPTNPHRVSLYDITGGFLDHADLYHVNGISTDADTTQLECAIDSVNDRILVSNLGGYSNAFLIDGISRETLTGIAAGVDGSVEFDTLPNTASGEYLIYIDSSGNLQKVKCGDPFWSVNAYIVDSNNTTASTPGDQATITWNATSQTLTYQAPGDGAPGAAVRIVPDPVLGADYRGYYKLYSSNLSNWIIVRCVGALGGSNSTVFDTSMTATHREELILKLGMVNWDLPTEILSNLRDIRQWRTADNQSIFLEEHDALGRHNKSIPHIFRVGVTSGPAIYAAASDSSAVAATAGGSQAVWARAPNAVGYFTADTASAVVGTASASFGVWGRAKDMAGYFTASASTNASIHGIYATASNASQAASAVGVKAVAYTAVWASGTLNGVYATASTAVSASGNYVGVCASAAAGIGVKGFGSTAFYGTATDIGVKVEAGTYGGSFSASEMGVIAKGDGSVDVAVWGVYGSAANASAGNIHKAIGVQGYVNAIGATGVYGINTVLGGVCTGVYGYVASGWGVFGQASASGATGVYGLNSASGCGVLGSVSAGTGVYGHAVDGTAVYALAGSGIGVSASAQTGPGLRVIADNGIGAYVSAGNYGDGAYVEAVDSVAGFVNGVRAYATNELNNGAATACGGNFAAGKNGAGVAVGVVASADNYGVSVTGGGTGVVVSVNYAALSASASWALAWGGRIVDPNEGAPQLSYAIPIRIYHSDGMGGSAWYSYCLMAYAIV